MERKKDYVDFLIDQARIDLKLKEIERKRKAAADEDELLRMLSELRGSRNQSDKCERQKRTVKGR